MNIILRNIWILKKIPVAIHASYQKYPVLSNSLAGFVTFSMGDMISQKIDSNVDIDVKRSLQIGLFGVLMNGSLLYNWYRMLDHYINPIVTSKATGVIIKVIADQIIYAPLAIFSFFSFSILRKTTSININTSFEQILEKLDHNFVRVYLVDCTLWPFVNFLNFHYIPLVFRSSFTSIAQLFWQTYLSQTTHHNNNNNNNNKKDKEEKEKENSVKLQEIIPSLNTEQTILTKDKNFKL
jgi:hypothetical protein